MRTLLFFTLGLIVGLLSLTVYAQTPFTPLANLGVYADVNGALYVNGSGGACGTTGPLTNAANIMVKADSNGALYVCGTFANPYYEAQIAALEARLAALESRD